MADLDFRAKFGLTVIGMRRGQEMIISPTADEKIQENDTLMLVGAVDDLDRLEAKMP